MCLAALAVPGSAGAVTEKVAVASREVAAAAYGRPGRGAWAIRASYGRWSCVWMNVVKGARRAWSLVIRIPCRGLSALITSPRPM